MLPSGNLRERISFKRPIRTKNSSGGYDTTYDVPYLQTYSKVDQLKASNDLIASKANLIQPFVFTIRYRLDHTIQIADIIEHRGLEFEILSFENDTFRTWITITARTTKNSSVNG